MQKDLHFEAEDSDIPNSTVVELPSDFPPESFWLSKDAEFDWFDRNAFLERKESTKGNSNSSSMNLNPSINPGSSHSTPSSQRYYAVNSKSKAAIIGLPKTQKTTYVDCKRRLCNKQVNLRLFPTRSNSVGNSRRTTVLVTEPSSPKVSCIGRVRSKRCKKNLAEKTIEPAKNASKRSGLMARFKSLFRSKGQQCRKSSKPGEKVKEPVESLMPGSRRICVSVKPVMSEPGTPTAPAGLGGMIRFASGRRSWGSSDCEDDYVSGRHSWDLGRGGA
uniref:uncharacterized protein LOC122607761 n=1 Tax=Erigeron canadensis TaxID=72917 RepID=UPI001CB98E98|nr:uncharacterized protein LOC122607761 [Erigeron canadensis]